MNNQSYYLVFDLDDTLLDTNQLRQRRARLVKELGGFAPARKRMLPVARPFNIVDFSRAVFPRDARAASQLVKLMNQGVRDSKRYLYPGVTEFLRALQRRHRLILLSYGDPSFQRRKLTYSGLGNFFSRVIITSSESSKLQALRALQNRYGNRLIFFENRLDTCRDARSQGIKTFRLRSSAKDRQYYQKLLRQVNQLTQS